MEFPQSAQTALYTMYEADIGAKLKQMENTVDSSIPDTQPFVIRLDGVSFKNFTSGLVKPFDERLTEALVNTTKDLVTRFSPVLGYCQSDEISLVFAAADIPDQTTEISDKFILDDGGQASRLSISDEKASSSENASGQTDGARPKKVVRMSPKVHIYSGRCQKLASITASYASARLNFHLSKANWDGLPDTVRTRMIDHHAYLDGRLVPTPDTRTVMECIFWRSNFDGLRNSISQISHANFTPRMLHHKTIKDQLGMLSTEKSVSPFRDYSAKHLFGIWVKKEQYELHGMINPRTGEPVPGPVLRSRLRVGSFNWADWTDEERIAFVFQKYWGNGGRWPPKDPMCTD
ncbi:tRNAHis guanylyltransferase-domain-containing protein [Phlyctochytrium arcticum]|nr:tRNAHis guanylyltransferase-domain-containing protein [Phlyctochytrium arcticum]